MSEQPSLADRFEALADYSFAPRRAQRTVQVDGNECFRIAEALRIAEIVEEPTEADLQFIGAYEFIGVYDKAWPESECDSEAAINRAIALDACAAIIDLVKKRGAK